MTIKSTAGAVLAIAAAIAAIPYLIRKDRELGAEWADWADAKEQQSSDVPYPITNPVRANDDLMFEVPGSRLRELTEEIDRLRAENERLRTAETIWNGIVLSALRSNGTAPSSTPPARSRTTTTIGHTTIGGRRSLISAGPWLPTTARRRHDPA